MQAVPKYAEWRPTLDADALNDLRSPNRCVICLVTDAPPCTPPAERLVIASPSAVNWRTSDVCRWLPDPDGLTMLMLALCARLHEVLRSAQAATPLPEVVLVMDSDYAARAHGKALHDLTTWMVTLRVRVVLVGERAALLRHLALQNALGWY